MHNSRFISILKGFSTKERTKFAEFVHSPYFNKHEKVQQLYGIVQQYAPHFNHTALDKQSVFSALYPDEVFHEGRFKNLLSDLLHLLYDFLSLRQWQADIPLRRKLLLDELLQSEIHPEVDRAARWYRQALENNPHRHHGAYLDNYHLYDKLDRIFSTKGQRSYDVNLQLKSDQLDLYFLSNKLKIACDMTSRNIVTESNYACHLLEELLEYYALNRKELSSHIAIDIYYKILQMLQDTTNESHFQSLKVQIAQHAAAFPQEELREIYVHALNYCIKMINSGHSKYYREILHLYQAMLSEGVVFRNGYLPQWTFKNIITTSIRLREFEWTAGFIEQYKERLLPEERDYALAFNLASLYFAQADYARALQQLHNIEFGNTSYHLGAKIIQLKSYFELGETEALLALVQASLKYVRRNKELSAYGKRTNTHFFKSARALAVLKNKKDFLSDESYRQLHQKTLVQLEAFQPVANKDWLQMELMRHAPG